MSDYEMTLEIPRWVEEGLADGSLLRDASGAVRHASGDGRGAIAAFLREPGPERSIHQRLNGAGSARADPSHRDDPRGKAPSGGAADPERETCPLNAAELFAGSADQYYATLDTRAAFAADFIKEMLTGVALVHLDKRLEVVDHLARGTLDLARQTLEAVQHIQEVGYLGFTRKVGRGVELIGRFLDGGDGELLPRARRRFEEGLADIKTLLFAMDGEQMLENAARVPHLLKSAALCAAGETQSLILSNSSPGEMAVSLRVHQGFWREILARLDAVPGPATRIPTLAMLETEKDRGLRRTHDRWRREAEELRGILEAERAFLEALQEAPVSLRKRIQDRARPGCEGSLLCLIRKPPP